MSAVPPAGQHLCALADIADPGARGFSFRDGDALFGGFVVRQGGAAFGYIDRCPHAGWPLSMSPDQYLTLKGDRILCAGHGALFTLDEGLCIGGPCGGRRLSPWPVAVVGGAVVTL